MGRMLRLIAVEEYCDCAEAVEFWWGIDREGKPVLYANDDLVPQVCPSAGSSDDPLGSDFLTIAERSR